MEFDRGQRRRLDSGGGWHVVMTKSWDMPAYVWTRSEVHSGLRESTKVNSDRQLEKVVEQVKAVYGITSREF